MEINKILLECYIIFGIILCHAVTFMCGLLYAEHKIEREQNNGESVQS